MGARGAILVFCALLSPIAQAQSATDLQRLLDSGLKKEKERDFDGAIAAYTQALAINPRHAKALTLRAEARLRAEDSAGAIADSTKAIEIDKNYARAYAVRSLANRYGGDSKYSPLADGKQAITLDPKDAYCHLAYACSFVVQSQYDRAIQKLLEAITLDPTMVAAWTARAEYKAYTGDKTGAVEDANRAIDIAPADPEGYLARGRVYQEIGDWDKAVADFTKSIELDPKGIVGLIHRGRAYNSRRRSDEAAEDATQALSLKPQSVAALCIRAQARLQAGNQKDSLADYDQAVKLHPTGRLYRDRGWARFAAGAWADAAADFRKYTSPYDDVTRLPLWIFLCRARVGERTLATEELVTFFERANKPSDWDQALARYLTGQSTQDELLEEVAKVAKGGDAYKYREFMANFYIGSLKAIEGKVGAAIAAFYRCIESKQWWRDEYIAASAELERLKKGK